MVMLAFAMMPVIPHHANPPPSKETKRRTRQKPYHSDAVVDPMVDPGSLPHCHQARAKADATCAPHRMVTLA
jgi:hypothetical protein